MTIRFIVAALLSILLAGPVLSQAELGDVEGSRLDGFSKPGDAATTVCTLTSLGAKSVIGTRDFVESRELVEKSERALAEALTDIFYNAQQNSGVSFDDLDDEQVMTTILAVQRDFDAERAAELAPALAENGEEPKEEWSSFDYARTALSVGSVADPTGALGVAAAYTYAKCGTPEAETGVGGFCWRNSHTRGVGWIPSDLGRVADCPPGMTNMGLTCQSWGDTAWRGRVADCPKGYTNNGLTCGRGGDTISAPSRLADCPKGFTNMGLSCFRGASTYSKKCTFITKHPCRAGYTDMGCFCAREPESRSASSMTCPKGYFKGLAQRCYKECPKGYENTGEFCTKWPSTLGISAMTCAKGEKKIGARCYRNCPPGYTNTGEFCQIWPETKGVSAMTCKSGEFKSGARCYPNNACNYTEGGQTKRGEMNAGLCYENCRKNFYGVGPVCWSSCNGKLKTECAAGCASSSLECGLATTDMVLSPVEMVVSVVSIGNYASAKAARKASMNAAREAAKKAGREAAQVVIDKAGRELAKEAAEKLFRESVDALDEELLEALLRYGDDIADAAPDAAKSFDDVIAEMDDLVRELDDLALDVGGELDELDDLAEQFAKLSKELGKDADAAAPMAKRIGQGIIKAARRSADQTQKLASFVKRNGEKLIDVADKNLYQPVKKAKNYVPNKLRQRSEIFDIFMANKTKYGKKWYVASPRMARSCAKAGIVIAKDVTGE